MRSAVIVLLGFVLIAGGTLGARTIRLERGQSERYARAITACANGYGYIIGRTVVSCVVAEVPAR